MLNRPYFWGHDTSVQVGGVEIPVKEWSVDALPDATYTIRTLDAICSGCRQRVRVCVPQSVLPGFTKSVRHECGGRITWEVPRQLKECCRAHFSLCDITAIGSAPQGMRHRKCLQCGYEWLEPEPPQITAEQIAGMKKLLSQKYGPRAEENPMGISVQFSHDELVEMLRPAAERAAIHLAGQLLERQRLPDAENVPVARNCKGMLANSLRTYAYDQAARSLHGGEDREFLAAIVSETMSRLANAVKGFAAQIAERIAGEIETQWNGALKPEVRDPYFEAVELQAHDLVLGASPLKAAAPTLDAIGHMHAALERKFLEPICAKEDVRTDFQPGEPPPQKEVKFREFL